MAVPSVVDRKAREEVEVLLAVDIPQARALAAHELDRRPGVGVHHVALFERPQVVDTGFVHGVTIVPMPASVKSSSRRLCGRRPSTMCAEPTPPRTAST